jgi:hypothetical protein
MPQYDDDLQLGPVVLGGPANAAGSSPMSRGVGPLGRVYLFDVVPVTSGTALLASSQNPLSGASFNLTAGAGVTTFVDATGVTRFVLDTPRCVTITAAGANTATYLVTGYDQYGQRMSQLLAAPTTSTVATLKAFKSIISVTNANATAGTNGLTVGFNDVLGLPLAISAVPYIMSVKWDVALADNAGTAVAADATSPATTATGDVRGTYLPTSAANGTRRLVMFIGVPAIACGPNATRVGAAGVPQV